MKRSLGFVLLALLPILGCNQSAPTPPEHFSSPPVNGEGTTVNNALTKNWYTYTASDDSYSVKFPGKPTDKSSSASDATGSVHVIISSYSTPDKTRTYSTSSMQIPLDFSANTEKSLDELRDGEVKQINAKVNSETTINKQGVPGREITMSLPNGNKAKARFYLVNKGKASIVFSEQVIDLERELDDAEAGLFLNSLEIKNK